MFLKLTDKDGGAVIVNSAHVVTFYIDDDEEDKLTALTLIGNDNRYPILVKETVDEILIVLEKHKE